MQNYLIKIFAGHENEWIHFWISNFARSDAGGQPYPHSHAHSHLQLHRVPCPHQVWHPQDPAPEDRDRLLVVWTLIRHLWCPGAPAEGWVP